MLTFLAAYLLVLLAVGLYVLRLVVADRRLAREQAALMERKTAQAGHVGPAARAA